MRNGGHKLDSNLVKTDVLIIGAGAAGLRVAIELAWQIVDVLVPVTILLEAGAIEPGTELVLNFPQFSAEERSIL